jgi:hypothetical protein
LLLARIFFEANFIPFAGEQIGILARQQPENKVLARLLEKLAPNAAQTAPGTPAQVTTVAEADFDLDAFDELESEKSRK